MAIYYSMTNLKPTKDIDIDMTHHRKRSATESVDDTSIDEIKTIVGEMISTNGTIKEKEKQFQTKYPHFAERYPMLFKMACKPEFDNERFSYILQMMFRVQNKEISYDNATKEFGQNMYDTYIKPTLDKS